LRSRRVGHQQQKQRTACGKIFRTLERSFHGFPLNRTLLLEYSDNATLHGAMCVNDLRASDGRHENSRGRAMAMAANDIERLIRARIPDAEVTIRDLAGDGDHYAATVIAESFRGKSRVQQHQIVYEALKAEMGGKLHALALQTGTPES
jgi:stress-induced morphogen